MANYRLSQSTSKPQSLGGLKTSSEKSTNKTLLNTLTLSDALQKHVATKKGFREQKHNADDHLLF